MLKFISSNVAARKTIKAQLQKEIPLINEAIEKAIANGKDSIRYNGNLSKPTVKLLTKANYLVNNLDSYNVKTVISWHNSYYTISDSDSELEKLVKELDIEIVEMQ